MTFHERFKYLTLCLIVSLLGVGTTPGCGSSPSDTASLDVAARRSEEEASRRARQNITFSSSFFPAAVELTMLELIYGKYSGAFGSGSYTIEGLVTDCLASTGTCTSTNLTEVVGGNWSSVTSCAAAVCLSAKALCVSHRLAEASTSVAGFELDASLYLAGVTTNGTGSITPPTAEQRTGLLAAARKYSQASVSIAGEALRRGMLLPVADGTRAGVCAPGAIASNYTPVGTTTPRSYADSLAMLLIEATQVTQENAESELAAHSALAAAELSRERDPAVATARSFSDTVFSLGVGAQAIVGGAITATDPIPGAGLCETNDGRRAVDTAVDLIRLAAGNPRRVFSTRQVSNQALFEQTATPVTGCPIAEDVWMACADTASVCTRLADRLGDSRLNGACYASILTDNNLTDADVTAARVRMRSEAIAFPVSETKALPSLPVGGGRTIYTRYVATANAPTPVHPLYYATLVRFGAASAGVPNMQSDTSKTVFFDTPDVDSLAPPSRVSSRVAERGSAGTMAYALAVAHSANAATVNALPIEAVNTLSTFLGASGGPGGAGRVEICHDTDAYSAEALHTVKFRIFDGVGPIDNTYRLVVGADGLRCAVQGSLNGASCNPADYFATQLSAYPPFYTSAPVLSPQTTGTFASAGAADSYANGPNAYTEFTLTLPRGPANLSRGNILLFVVKQTAIADAPGRFEPIAGYRAPVLISDAKNRCSIVPFYGAEWELAGKALTPSTSNCSRPVTSCAGTREDGPIPLENELSSDGDDFESSWRHYLDEARRAAALADQLGEQVIELGLSNDMRAEVAEEELEATCGTASGIGALMPGDLASARGGACPMGVLEGAPCSTTSTLPLSDYICRGGFCVADPAKVIARRAASGSAFEGLSECLSDSSVHSYVGLGNKKLCAWSSGGVLCNRDLGGCGAAAEGEACTASSTVGVCRSQRCMFDPQCPIVPADGAVTCPAGPAGSTSVFVGVDPGTAVLGLFIAPPGSPTPNPSREATIAACQGLRRLRTNLPPFTSAPGNSRADVVDSIAPHFRFERIEEYARGVGWEGRPFSNSAITFAGAPLYETDDPRTMGTALTSWPCAQPAALAGKCSGSTPDNPSLFCSTAIAAYCGANTYMTGAALDRPAAEARAVMNERMARAVITLRAITNTGFRGVVAPYQPTQRYLAYRSDKEGEGLYGTEGGFGTYPARFSATFTAATAVTFYGGSSSPAGSFGGGFAYHGFELDGPTEHDDYGEFPAVGFSHCVLPTQDTETWRWPVYAGGPLGSPSSYRRYDGSCTFPVGGWPVMFRESTVSADSDATRRILPLWWGLDDDPNTNASQGTHGTIAGMMMADNGAVGAYLAGGPSDPFVPLVQAFADADLENTASIYPSAEFTECDSGSRCIVKRLSTASVASRDVLDALELACELEVGNGPVACSSLPTPNPENINDLDMVESYLGCIGDEMSERASREILSDVPNVALDGLRPGYEFKGRRGAAASRVTQGLIGLRRFPREIADAIVGMKNDIRRLRLQLQGSEVRGELISLSETAAVSANVASCLGAVASGASVSGLVSGGPWTAAITCADSAIQIAVAVERAQLQAVEDEINLKINWVDFANGFRDRAAALKNAGDGLETATTELRGGLADLETERQGGLRSLARALLADSDAAGRYYPVNTVMRRRFNTAKIRYERQRDYAVKMAWMARRAVEQRLGMPLAEMRTDMSFVDAPAVWADELCTFRGIDYARIRAGGGDGPDDFADAYLGDYVEMLDRVVQSYQRDYPFHESADTTVVSLRDDILGTRAFCDQPVPNLLGYSGALDTVLLPGDESRVTQNEVANPLDGSAAPVLPDGGIGAPTYIWERVGCSSADAGPLATSCIGVDAYEVGASRRPWGQGASDGPAFRVAFDANALSNAAVQQEVWLATGTYRLSWYRFAGESGASDTPVVDVVARPSGGAVVSDGGERRSPDDGTNVFRYHRFLRVSGGGTEAVPVLVRMLRTGSSAAAFVLGGLMLEDVTTMYPTPALPGATTDAGAGGLTSPGAYVGTTEPGVGRLQVCEDTTGAEFRREWRYDCTRLCAGGWGSCTLGPTHCFWETSFSVTPESLERGGQFRRAGFAYGNFNYRFRNISMNVVGTGVRSCTDSMSPTTCYSDGSIRYSIEHNGPFTVTNHLGDEYDAPLFVGAVEHARALAAERYITNPISGADRAMIEQYRHGEMRGRPLSGNYTVRIWNEDGIQFSNIEDVQIVLEYGYWTRQR